MIGEVTPETARTGPQQMQPWLVEKARVQELAWQGPAALHKQGHFPPRTVNHLLSPLPFVTSYTSGECLPCHSAPQCLILPPTLICKCSALTIRLPSIMCSTAVFSGASLLPLCAVCTLSQGHVSRCSVFCYCQQMASKCSELPENGTRREKALHLSHSICF